MLYTTGPYIKSGHYSDSAASEDKRSENGDQRSLDDYMPCQKKKRQKVQLEFEEVESWEQSWHSDDYILVFISKILDDLN